MEMSGNQMYENLKKIVRKRGRILKDVCKEIDINENTLKSGITNKTIKLNNLLKLASVLNVDYKKIIEGEEYKINKVHEEQAEYKNGRIEQLKVNLDECRKDKERAWEMVSWLQDQVDELKKKEAS